MARRIFSLPDRRHLWDDSDDEDNNQAVQRPTVTTTMVSSSLSTRRRTADTLNSNIEMIDLSRSPDRSVSASHHTTVGSSAQVEQLSLPPPPAFVQQEQQEQQTMAPYVPRTLQQDSRRYSILPAFPTSFYNNRPPLLLANVPKYKLNQEQLARRRTGVYTSRFQVNRQNFDIPSYFLTKHQNFVNPLVYHYNVDEPILDYNLYRLSECFGTFAADYIRHHKYHAEQFELDEKQMKYALEFYLQIDVDLFFMKTCAFRHAKPRSDDEGLFCNDEPNARYGLLPCNNCPLCVPPYDITRRQEPAIRFGPSQKFRFVNGYQTILNCSAGCQTRNIIYVMTCPCNEFEYVGETGQRLGDRLWYHRQHLNRMIHEFLIGKQNVKLSRVEPKDYETLVKDRMLLYKHAARCSWAIQMFLDFNPIYGCFVPITTNEALQHNRNYILPSSLVLLDSINPTSVGSQDRRAIPATEYTRSDEAVRSCMRHIPDVPAGYTFSVHQRIQQFQYFKDKLDIKIKPHDSIDLFNVAIIAVLPVDASEPVRRFVESLFITHTEAKLNTFGQLLRDDDDNNDDNDDNMHGMSSEAVIADRGEWCRNVLHRSRPMSNAGRTRLP